MSDPSFLRREAIRAQILERADRVPEEHVVITYTNHRGVTEKRRVCPMDLWFGRTDHYPGPQWLLLAWCFERKALRNFAMTRVEDWAPVLSESSAREKTETGE